MFHYRALAIWILLGCAGCASDDPGISPTRDEFYFPTGLALDYWVDPSTGERDFSRPLLFVSNSNADLRFNGGTIQVLNIGTFPESLTEIGRAVREKRISCAPSPLDPEIWHCPESDFVDGDATIRVGDLPARVEVGAIRRDIRSGTDLQQEDESGQSHLGRLFSPIRGQDYLAWTQIVYRPGGKVDLRCATDSVDGCGSVSLSEDCPVWDCDEAHQVNFSQQLGEALPAEPFGMIVNPNRSKDSERITEHIYTTHLSGGEVSFFVSTDDGVELVDIANDFFSVDGVQVGGAVDLSMSEPGNAEKAIYVSSRRSGDVAAFVVRDDQRIVPLATLSLGGIVSVRSGDRDLRGIAAGVSTGSLFALTRSPPGLFGIDASFDILTDFPREPIWFTETCSGPSQLVLGPDPAGDGQGPVDALAYVVCFGSSQIYVIDTHSGQLMTTIDTGRGPNALVLDKRLPRAFVTHFLENTIGIIDLDPSHKTYRQMIARIGTQKDVANQ